MTLKGKPHTEKQVRLSPCHAGECLRVLSFPLPLFLAVNQSLPFKGMSETQGKECRLPPIVSSLRG